MSKLDINYEPVDLEASLGSIKKDRPVIWGHLVGALAENRDEFSALSSEYVGTAEAWLHEKSSTKFCTLLSMAMDRLDFDSEILRTLRSLQDSYSAMKVKNVCPEVIEADLGSSVTIEVDAEGCPAPKFRWFFWPSSAGAAENGKLLEGVSGASLMVDGFRLADAGFYRCFVSHCLPVAGPDGREVAGFYTPATEIKAKANSVIVLEQPQSASRLLSTEATFGCIAESPAQLAYQWFHEKTLLAGQCGPTLTLAKVHLDHRGSYFCRIETGGGQCSGEASTVFTEKAVLSVTLPTSEDIQAMEFGHENIEILQQPSYNIAQSSRKAAIGEKVSLTCLAGCKYPLRYEWLRQGIRSDLISQGPDFFTDILPVGHGCVLDDEIEAVQPPVSTYVYQCVVRCPTTGERVSSDLVRIPVSTLTVQEKCLPMFKVALVICQDTFDDCETFHTLHAPRNDGQALVQALHAIDFEVLAFSNLKVEEIRRAMDLLQALVDENTYVLFYFNGHALGHGSDIYLVGTDTSLAEHRLFHSSVPDQLIWHGEVEGCLDKLRPLFITVIYDSCRDQPPEHIAELLAKDNKRPIPGESNFCIGYGTRQSKRSFEKLDKNGRSHGLYMKYLLKHIGTPLIRVGEVFDRLNRSFTEHEDASIVAQMKPEHKDSTRQKFCLSNPLRHARLGWQSRLFFRLFRFEALHNDFSEDNPFSVGLAWDGSGPQWVTLRSRSGLVPWLTLNLTVRPNAFVNEATLSVGIQLAPGHQRGREDLGWLLESKLQVVPVNVPVVQRKRVVADSEEHSLEMDFLPCAKKAGLGINDGPTFDITAVPNDAREAVKVGECTLHSLQALAKTPLFRMNFIYKGNSCLCQGLVEMPVPMVKNSPRLKLANHIVSQSKT